MKDTTIEDPFYKQIQNEINRIEYKQELNRALYYVMRITQICLTGYITYLSGGQESNMEIILRVGVATTGITAIETLFKFDSKKDIYSLLLFDLRQIRAEFVFYWISNKIDEKIKSDLFDRYQEAKSSIRKMIIKANTAQAGGSVILDTVQTDIQPDKGTRPTAI
jgi:hypothetical protein